MLNSNFGTYDFNTNTCSGFNSYNNNPKKLNYKKIFKLLKKIDIKDYNSNWKINKNKNSIIFTFNINYKFTISSNIIILNNNNIEVQIYFLDVKDDQVVFIPFNNLPIFNCYNNFVHELINILQHHLYYDGFEGDVRMEGLIVPIN